jgi:hypothetical protein
MHNSHYKVAYEGPVYSPFSGQPAEDEEGPNFEDETLQWIYCGDAGSSSHVGNTLLTALGNIGEDEASQIDFVVVMEAARKAGCLVLEVDTGWNGLNWYGFLPKATL